MKKTLFLSAILATALCSSAFAAEYTFTASDNGNNNNTARINQIHTLEAGDTIIFNKASGHLTQCGGEINAAVRIDALTLTDGYSDRTYTFNGTVTGAGAFSFGGTTGANNQHYVFNGDVSGYSGNMSLANNKTGSFTFNNTTGTGSISGANVTVNLNGATVNSSSINVATINVSGNTNIEHAHVDTAALNITSGVLTIGSTASVNFTGTDGWTANETARTGDNGFGTATYTRDFGANLVNNGTITLKGNATTNNNGVVTGTATSTTYYVNETADGLNLTGAQHLVVKGGVTASLSSGITLDSVEMEAGSALNMAGKKLTLNAASSISNLTVQDMDFKQFASVAAATQAAYIVTMSGTNTVNGTLDFSRSSRAAATVKVLEGGSLTHNGTNLWMSSTNPGILLEKGAVFNRSSGFSVKGLSSDAESLGQIAWTTTTADGTFNGLSNANVTIRNAELSVNATATISTALNNVVLKNNGHALTMNTDAVLSGAELTAALNVNSGKSLTISGTASFTGTTQTRQETPDTTNGYGATITYANAFSGEGSVSSTASWTLNGKAATLNGKELSYSTSTGVYYINVVTSSASIDEDTILVSNLGDTTYTEFISLSAGKTLTITDGQSLTMAGAANKGVWMSAGSSVVVSNNATLTNFGLTFKNATITNTSEDTGVQIGVHEGGNGATEANRHFMTVTGDVTVGKDVTLLRDYTFDNANVTIASGITTNINSALSDTTDLTVNSGSVATFSGDASVKSVAGAGELNLSHNLTVAGNASIGSLTLSNGANITAETISGKHNGTITLTGLNVTDVNSEMNGDLVMAGGTMIFANNTTLTMGCAVTIGMGNTVTVELTEEMVDIIAGGGRVDLFTSVETATLGSHIVFTGTNGAALDKADVYSLQYDEATKTIYATPEPATATLSLLALAALAARRKRH